jgi:exosortase A
MKLNTELFPGVGVAPSASQRRLLLAVGLAVLIILALYWRTAASMVAIWWRSETFAHGFVIVPICLWLAWRRRDALAQVETKPWWPGLIGVVAAGALWLVSSAADVLAAKQFALAFMIQASIVTVVGTSAARVLAFPLAFLLFAVPVGEILVPTFVDWTADFTVGALRASGVPVYREGNHFVIPSGMWSVVEACAGLRYLIASLMVGTLYAMLAYRGALRRTVFITASIVVPIIANWLRAYLIVLVAHLSSNKLAVGIDHVIYGWLFFGVVMLLLFWIGSFWQEAAPQKAADVPTSRSTTPKHAGRSQIRPVLPAAIAAVAIASLWLPIEATIKPSMRGEAPTLPVVTGSEEWKPSDAPTLNWKPHYAGFASERAQTFRRQGRDVGLYLAYYRGQEKGRELITSGNALVTMSEWDWKLVYQGSDTVDWRGEHQTVDEAVLSGPGIRLQVFQLYWVSGTITSSQYKAKVLTAWSVLTGRGDDSALIVIYTPQLASAEEARGVLRGFAAAMSPAIERSLAAAQAGPG